MLSQYAGWPVKHGDFFAMGSGPMRVRRGREALLELLAAQDPTSIAVGTLECDQLPSDALIEAMAAECNVAASDVWLAVAPTRSIAGCGPVVARSVETALHKLHELHFPLEQVHSAYASRQFHRQHPTLPKASVAPTTLFFMVLSNIVGHRRRCPNRGSLSGVTQQRFKGFWSTVCRDLQELRLRLL